ncbi:MAG TPA: hypothetical protein DEP72_08890 [Clostridiales bacterium]|nr:MAG: hypothetical protein A2Y18_03830 [Clostridiales bacterium GWD2_32_19]HCC08255.1 hypothetical protein [Clostridiales bacterium]
MKKYIITILILFTLVFTTSVAHANKQSSIAKVNVDDITYNEIVDSLTGESTKRSIVKISWEDSPDSFEVDTSEGIVQGDLIHPTTKYEIYLQNLSQLGDKKLLTVVDSSVKQYEIGTSAWLVSGNLYQIQVIPVHYHDKIFNSVTSQVKAEYVITNLENHPKVIAFTDYNITLNADGKEITVVWEDAGIWVNYDIYYEKGDISDYNNMSGKIEDVRDLSTKFIDTDKKVKLRYVIKTSDIKSGQLYSVSIRPKINNINGVNVYVNPRTNVEEVTTKVPFKIEAESDKYIKLSWWGIDNTVGISGEITEYSVRKLQIMRKDTDSASEQIIATIEGQESIDIGYYTDLRSENKTNYRIKITYTKMENGMEKTIYMYSDWEMYDPGAFRITPAKPEVPKLNEILSKDDNVVINIADYDGAFKINKTENIINIVWSVFERLDYSAEDPANTVIQDLDTYYDIWLTDDANLLYTDNDLCVESNFYVSEEQGSATYVKDKVGTKIGFYKEYSQYLAAIRENGLVIGYKLKDLDPNKIYYIKIVAKKKLLNEVLESEPAMLSVYYDSDETIYAPPVLSKPPLKIDQLESDNIKLMWRLSWWEVVSSEDIEQNWYNQIWLINDDIVFTETAGAEKINLNSQEDVNKLKAKIDLAYLPKYTFRQINLGDNIGYEMKTLLYTDVEAAILNAQQMDSNYTLEDYIKSIKDTTGEINGWEQLIVKVDPADKTNQTLYFTKEKLTNNTSYMFVIKTYRTIVNGSETERLYCLNPTTIIGTTLINGTEVIPKPTVPNLFLDEARDIQVELKWEYNTKMEYEMKINEKEDFNTARDNEVIIPTNSTDPKFPKDGEDYVLTIIDLLPKTEYYFWIKSKQKDGNEESAWSNPILVKTTDILPNPINPPEGIGVADITDPIGDTYITIEWTRLLEDLSSEETNKNYKVKKLFSYILIISDNSKFLDARQIEIKDDNVGSTENGFEMIEKSLVKVNGLETNKKYYFKLKSKVSAKKGDSAKIVTSESNYSLVKAVKTSTDNEFDASTGEFVTPLTDKATTTYVNEILTYTITDGQRVINDILMQDEYRFTIDMKNYTTTSSAGKTTVANKTINKRVASVPYEVIETLKQQKMNFDIVVDDMKISIPVESLSTPTLTRAKQLGGLKNYLFTISTPSETSGTSNIVVSKSKEITITIQTKHGNIDEKYLNGYVVISYDTAKASTTTTSKTATSTTTNNVSPNAKAYKFDTNKNIWIDVPEQYNSYNGTIIFKTSELGKFGLGGI